MAVQNPINKKTVAYLRQLDLSTDEIDAYLYLLSSGPQTVLSLSRGLKSGRTKLYPLLEELAGRQLIFIRERHYGTSYSAQPPERLEALIHEAEQKAHALRKGFSAAVDDLKDMQKSSPAMSKIIEYSGEKDIKQMYWNMTKARTEVNILKHSSTNKLLGKYFVDKINHSLEVNKIRTRMLSNKRLSSGGYLDPKVFKIEYEVFTYDNVTAFIQLGEDISGVEIHNRLVWQHQQYLFDHLWRHRI